MCTLTWLPAGDRGYDLFFNRDEFDARGPELPPELLVRNGSRVVAPRDADQGGTWLALNEYGMTTALLNYYPSAPGTAPTPSSANAAGGLLHSRGEVPWLGADMSSADRLSHRLRSLDLSVFRPFHLVAVDAGGGSGWFRWDGRSLHSDTAPAFLTSSSHNTVAIEAARQQRFNQLSERSREALNALHRHHDRARGAESICMRRENGRTRSICTVVVRAGLRQLTYEKVAWEEPEATTPPPWVVTL